MFSHCFSRNMVGLALIVIGLACPPLKAFSQGLPPDHVDVISTEFGQHVEFSQDSLTDQSILYETQSRLTGTVSRQVKVLLINGQAIPLMGRWFSVPIHLKAGKNIVKLVCINRHDEVIDVRFVRTLVKRRFLDVHENHWTAHAVEDLATLGLLEEALSHLFRPEEDVSLLALTNNLFNSYGYDLVTHTRAADSGKRLLLSAERAGLFDGLPKSWQQNSTHSLTWGEALTMIINAEGLNALKPRSSSRTVSEKHWAYPALQIALAQGYVPVAIARALDLDAPIAKGELAYLMSRTLRYEKAIQNLYDWDQYLSPTDRVYYRTIQATLSTSEPRS